MSSGEEDTSIREAFRKASLKKLAKQAAKRKEREKAKEARLAKVRERTPEEALAERPPAIVPEQTGAALQVQSQHFMQDKTARERKIRELARIATRGEKAERPPTIEAEPKPITPDDPRVLNGTLAPSPRVAKHLAPEAVEARQKDLVATGAATIRPPERERPLQTSPFPEGFLEKLETMSPQAILGGRKPSQLRGVELDAYRKAVGRRLRAGRNPSGPRKPAARYKRTPLGIVVTEYRLAAKLTAKELAELADIKLWRLMDLMSFVKTPRAEEIEALRKALDIPEEKLVLNGIAAPEKNAKPAKLPAENRAHAEAVSDAMRAYYDRKAVDPRWYTPKEGDLPYQLRIKELIRAKNISPPRLAERANVTADVCRRMLREPAYWTTLDKLKRIATALGTTIEAIAPERLVPPERFPDPSLLSSPSPEGIEKPSVGELVKAAVAEGYAAGAALATPSIPKPPIEKGVPIPAFAVRSDWYRWEEMEKGDSFLATCPAGLPWPTFRDRFLKLADRQAEKLGHWYVNEADETAQTVRIWRIL